MPDVKWESLPLGELCEFRRGLTYKKGDEVESGGTPVLRANNVDLARGELDLDEIRYIDPAIVVPEAKKVVAGSLLICTASGSKKHLGKTALIEDEMDFAFGGFMGLLVPRPRILPRYLQWLLRSDAYWSFIDGLSDGANINNLKFKQLAEFPVSLPPLEEQQRIVAVLDEAFEGLARARAHAEANLQNARELFENALEAELEAVDNSHETSLGEHIDLLAGFAFKSKGYTEDQSAMRLVRGDNIIPGAVRWEGAKYWPIDACEAYEKFQLRANDVLIAMDRTWIKAGIKYAVLSDEDVPSLLVQRVARLRCLASLDTHFLAMLIGSKSFERYVLSIQTGTGVPHISPTQIKDFKFPLPDIDTQARIVEKLLTVKSGSGELSEAYQSKIQDLDDLRQSLLQKAFAGELT